MPKYSMPALLLFTSDFMLNDGPFNSLSIQEIILKLKPEYTRKHESNNSVATELALGCTTQIQTVRIIRTHSRIVEGRRHRLWHCPLVSRDVIDLNRIQWLARIVRVRLIISLSAEDVDFVLSHTGSKVKPTDPHATYLVPFVRIRLELVAVVESTDATTTAHHIKAIIVADYTTGYELVWHTYLFL